MQKVVGQIGTHQTGKLLFQFLCQQSLVTDTPSLSCKLFKISLYDFLHLIICMNLPKS